MDAECTVVDVRDNTPLPQPYQYIDHNLGLFGIETLTAMQTLGPQGGCSGHNGFAMYEADNCEGRLFPDGGCRDFTTPNGANSFRQTNFRYAGDSLMCGSAGTRCNMIDARDLLLGVANLLDISIILQVVSVVLAALLHMTYEAALGLNPAHPVSRCAYLAKNGVNIAAGLLIIAAGIKLQQTECTGNMESDDGPDGRVPLGVETCKEWVALYLESDCWDTTGTLTLVTGVDTFAQSGQLVVIGLLVLLEGLLEDLISALLERVHRRRQHRRSGSHAAVAVRRIAIATAVVQLLLESASLALTVIQTQDALSAAADLRELTTTSSARHCYRGAIDIDVIFPGGYNPGTGILDTSVSTYPCRGIVYTGTTAPPFEMANSPQCKLVDAQSVTGNPFASRATNPCDEDVANGMYLRRTGDCIFDVDTNGDITDYYYTVEQFSDPECRVPDITAVPGRTYDADALNLDTIYSALPGALKHALFRVNLAPFPHLGCTGVEGFGIYEREDCIEELDLITVPYIPPDQTGFGHNNNGCIQFEPFSQSSSLPDNGINNPADTCSPAATGLSADVSGHRIFGVRQRCELWKIRQLCQ